MWQNFEVNVKLSQVIILCICIGKCKLTGILSRDRWRLAMELRMCFLFWMYMHFSVHVYSGNHTHHCYPQKPSCYILSYWLKVIPSQSLQDAYMLIRYGSIAVLKISGKILKNQYNNELTCILFKNKESYQKWFQVNS